MRLTELAGERLKLIAQMLQSAYSAATFAPVLGAAAPSVADTVPWPHPGGRSGYFWDSVKEASRHGVLDRLLVAASDDRPHRADLRALVLLFASATDWQAPYASHGLSAKTGLELLTTIGDPFMGTTLLAEWLIGVERRVAQVRCGAGTGTGFLVGPDLLLTCYHVVKELLEQRVPATDVGVRFDYRKDTHGRLSPTPWLPIDPEWIIPHSRYSEADLSLDGEPGLGELDYALLKLQSPIGSAPPDGESDQRGWVDISKDAPCPSDGAPILIVQHPRDDAPPPQVPPAQLPLSIAFATPGCAGLNANGTRLRHQVSTLPGSSGSPVFDGTLTAVALHHNRGQLNPHVAGLVLENRAIPLQRVRGHLSASVRDLLRPC